MLCCLQKLGSSFDIQSQTASDMGGGNDRFNAEAAAWDSNPAVLTASTMALGTLLEHVPELRKFPKHSASLAGLDVLEIGCGTGLLSLMIAPYVRTLTAVDTAQGMIDAFDLKLRTEDYCKTRNVLPVHVMLEDPNDVRIRRDPLSSRDQRDDEDQRNLPPRRFDLIISHLVLHHIPSLEAILRTMFGCLKSGGRVALTDFENFGPDARKFHPEHKMEGVERHGIVGAEMKSLMEEVGFSSVKIEKAFEMSKEVEGGGNEDFPFLICLGMK